MRVLMYLQFQAFFLWLVLAGGWVWAGLNRRRERRRRQRMQQHGQQRWRLAGADPCKAAAAAAASGAAARPGGLAAPRPGPGTTEPRHHTVGAAAAAAPPPPPSPPQPPVSVVMPVKGCRPHSADNWESQLAVEYGGPLEFVFVAESADDPALPLLRELAARRMRGCGCGVRAGAGAAAAEAEAGAASAGRVECGGAAGPSAAGAAGGAACGCLPAPAVRTVVAGLATSCSQKAHNLCAGIEAADPRVGTSPGGYVLCLDDDVGLHPGSLAELVAELEAAAPGAFMATGYPFDVPPPGSSFPAYLALSYHLPLLIAFSVRRDTAFVWGGCMLLRGRELAPGDPRGLRAAWRRGGYSDDLILASLCTQQRLPIRVPPFAIFPQRLDPRMTWRAWLNYLHRQLFVLDTYTNEHNRKTNHTMMVVHSVLSWALVLPSLAGLATLGRKLLLGALAAAAAALELTARAATAAGTAAAAPTTAAAAAASSASTVARPWSAAALAAAARAAPLPAGALAVAAGWLAAHLALVFMTAEVLALFRQLSPGRPAIPLRWYRWGRLWAALLLSNTLLPPLMLYTYLCPHVEWGGVVYRKHRGRVTPVRRRRADATEQGAVAEAEGGAAGPAARGHARRRL